MKKPSRLRRLLSLNQHRKRWGARRHAPRGADFSSLKETIIDFGDAEQTRGSTKSLDQHLENLRREFAGQSELLWYHAKLIVLIRREFQTSQQYAEFRSLWEQEGDFLRENLNIRWLVSATDTFAEHDPGPAVRAVAMMASVLVNTVKMQESERFITNAADLSVDPARVATLQEELVPLFEGMSCFTVGTDDTLRNMMWRLHPFMSVEPAGPILDEIWRRFQVEDTVFNRMRILHRRKKTRWWEE
ncbi:hypothetical protein [Pseudothioclava nitratireducens]|uniref:hypothetical protein n=1 Tax=Pseudothioclava nitratireducens TaxID=1928646 RepID=UPI0023D9D7D5|nr:hypothetical protein [Defluviimonas nitratireducens]MDF1621765.1 hypothetical protein [Defluviimonas nitratireducens]